MKNEILKALPNTNDILTITDWVNKNESKILYLINNASCKKWFSKYHNPTSFLYPCVCSTRIKACVIIEIYFKLKSILEINQNELLYKKAIDEYITTTSTFNIGEWLFKYSQFEELLSFSNKVIVIYDNAKWSKIIFPLREIDFTYALILKSIFEKINYNETSQ
ncbi:hypothetical protein HX071_17455 [Myroides marinus]|uniref:hypothetical protein n=1 Tax=Myroides marinus TaxID=703342 RepID=UPI0025775D41|nr:hypothetical protein [Myroides marinus]MDM1503967.1 hypothetical protein [Myroides marinus]MDM1534280.1 hypothetical protein [Myroides marinus]MDM1541225.1 hypothetical protein [Myroides marinus]